MALVLLLLVLALVFGGVGIFVEGLFWLAVIGGILLLASGFSGYRSFHTHSHH